MASVLFSPGKPITWQGRPFLRGVVPMGDNRGQTFTIAQPLGGRYQIVRCFTSGGMGLLLEGLDLRTRAPVLIKTILRYAIAPYAKVADRAGFTQQLLLPRKTLEMERRILVLLRNAGVSAVPHPNDFVYDANPQLEGPYVTEDKSSWIYDDLAMVEHEPYLVMEAVAGTSLEEILRQGAISQARTLRIFGQILDVLGALHEPRAMKPGMTWQLIYQDLKPANILVSAQDRATLVDMGGCQLLNLVGAKKLLPGAATAGYCAPECERPLESLTPKADIYSVGANLFHALTGKSPLDFFGGIPMPQPRAVRFDLEPLRGVCSRPLRRIVRQCLDPDPSRRFADVPALQRALFQAAQATSE